VVPFVVTSSDCRLEVCCFFFGWYFIFGFGCGFLSELVSGLSVLWSSHVPKFECSGRYFGGGGKRAW